MEKLRQNKSTHHPVARFILKVKADAAKAELARIDRPLWTVQAVARVLYATEDFIRRIPRSDLPVIRIGKRNLYLPADVVHYAEGRRVGAGLDLATRRQVLDSLADSVRERSCKKGTQHEVH